MAARKTLLITSLAVLGFLAPVVRGGAPMGPPMSILEQGRWSFGLEYGHEEADLDFETPDWGVTFVSGFFNEFTLEEFEADMVFGTLAYGLLDNWDLFLRLGAADAGARPGGLTSLFGELHSEAEFAWGVGTRASFWQRGPWRLGGLAQVTWFNPQGHAATFTSTPEPPDGPISITRKVDLDYWQAQISLSAIYQAHAWRLWAGPLLQIRDGDVDLFHQVVGGPSDGLVFDVSGDLEEEVRVGGHFGVSWQVADRWNLWFEGQTAEDFLLLGIGGAFMP